MGDYAPRSGLMRRDRQGTPRRRIEFFEVRTWKKDGSRAACWAAWRSFSICRRMWWRELYLEGHTGLLRYSDTGIDANTGFGVLRVSGQRLTLLAMTGEELRIGGLIDRVEWVTGC